MSLHCDPPLARALTSLDGLSTGDALGQLLSARARSARRIIEQEGLPSGRWWHTDDTQMGMAVVEELSANGGIRPESLAKRFVRRFRADPGRGYGKGARMQLEQIAGGTEWRVSATGAFGGHGSMGNGSAMRVAPLGAWFADDMGALVEQARLSAMVTHCHPEGLAGGIAVAVVAGVAWNTKGQPLAEARSQMWDAVLRLTPEGETRQGLRKAAAVPPEMAPELAARLLGSGFLVTAPDTVPFALWCAARHLDNYREALTSTLEGDGDCDTNCAIVGGIVALRTGREGIPLGWLMAREPLDLELVHDHP